MKNFSTFIGCLILLISGPSISSAYDTDNVHPNINNNALIQSNADNYLQKHLGVINGIRAVFKDKRITEWIKDGGVKEDETICRSRNHFHDPLKAWDSAGLNNLFINTFCFGIGEDLSMDSSIIWSQKEPGLLLTKNFWSWPKAREYYYGALTGNNEEIRESSFAQTFRSLGQVMHLIADSSVPAHVRNDIHVFPLTIPGIGVEVGKQTYESWAQKYYKDHSVKNVDLSIFTQAALDSLAPIPISALWDQNRYIGTNPAVTWTTDPVISGIGIAEFTNANFLSEDTIFKHYTHPAKENTSAVLVEQTAKDGATDKVWYIQGYTSERLAAYSYFNKWLSSDKWAYNLDDYVYQDYASQLIPRAVGYSAGLLDYFFRGSIEISLPNSGMYAQTADAGTGFSKITLLARNTTSNGDEMTNGSIEIVVKYKVALQDPFQSSPVPTSEQFSYKVVAEKNNIRSIPNDSTVELTFDMGQSTIVPINATDIYIQVIYKGRLGNEDGAVAVGMKDISEPTPVDIFDNMDMICLNGNWYVAGSPDAIAQVDENHNGDAEEWDVFPHDIRDAYIKISSAGNPLDASPSEYTFYSQILNAGALFRTYILSDIDSYALNVSDYLTAEKIDARDTFNHDNALILGSKTGYAIRNQVSYNVEDEEECERVERTAPCDIRYYPVFYSFRGKKLWGPAGFIVDNPKYPETTNCSWDLLN